MKKGLIVVLIVLTLGLFGCSKKESGPKVVRDYSESHVAYVKINPSVKINYSLACSEYRGGEKKCGAPMVTSYEAVNDDAKTILDGIDLLADGNKLNVVIQKIAKVAEDKGVEVSKISVESDWADINAYLEASATIAVPNTNTEEGGNSGEVPPTAAEDIKQYSFEVTVEPQETINNNIQTEVAEETAAKEEAAKKAQEAADKKAQEEAAKKAKEEAAAKARAERTIYLKDNVTYNLGGRGYCCEGCLTDSVIKSIKNATGIKVTSADHDRIDFMFITDLSGKYNETKYKGSSSSVTNKLKNAGAEECGGLGGGEPEPLTKTICRDYNLLCE